MDINYYVFRKTSFGGFNRKDVIDYIESIKNEYADYKSKAEKTIAELEARIEELESCQCSMENTTEELSAETETSEELCEETSETPETPETAEEPEDTKRSVIDCLCLNAEEKEETNEEETVVISDEMERFYETIKNFSFDYDKSESKQSKEAETSILDSITTFIF